MRIKVRAGKPSGSRPAGRPSYTVDIEPGILREAGARLKARLADSRVFVLTNDRVGPLYLGTLEASLRGAGFDERTLVIPDGERHKNQRTYKRIIDWLVSCRADRQSVLAALGGGVVGDLGGFAAATYMRGIPLVHVPTTLVAQVDSSIGGKVGIDHRDAKNLVGSFYNPYMVLADPDVLATLKRRDVLNGLFEAIKVALVTDRDLYDFIAGNLEGIVSGERKLLSRMVVRCAREKAAIVEEDPFDEGRRMVLNFGHTVGHALETFGRYRSISHGEGVGLGMLVALEISSALGYIKGSRAREISAVLGKILKPDRLRSADARALWQTIALDKKGKDGRARFILLKDIGRPTVEDVEKRTFLKAMRRI